MRQGPSNRRPRGRNNGGNRRPNLPNRNQTFESSGPDVRIRGNAYQVHEKYLALARDAGASGDRVMAENYLQHAEHYYRIILAVNEAHAQAQQQQQPNNNQGFQGEGSRDNGSRGGQASRGDNGSRSDQAARNGDFDDDDGQPDFPARDYDPRDRGGQVGEFGEDPRQADVRDASDERSDGGNGKDAKAAAGAPEPKAVGEDADGASAPAEDAPRPPRRRRAAGRPRRPAGNGADSAEPATDPRDQADFGI